MHSSRQVAPNNVSASGLAMRIAIPALGLIGMGISGYLTYAHYQWTEPICFAGLDCNGVLFSPYAQILGVPISLLGLLMYAILTACGLLLLRGQKDGSRLIALGIYGAALSGTLYSAYLTYREAFTLHAFCSWCLVSAVVITSILALSLVNLAASGLRLLEIPRLTRTKLSGNGGSITTAEKGEIL